MKSFEIGEYETRVGVVVFSDEPKLEIALDDHFDKDSFNKTLSQIKYTEGF